MITFGEANSIAKKLRKDIDVCMEHTDAYIFSRQNDISFGGDDPVVVLKKMEGLSI